MSSTQAALLIVGAAFEFVGIVLIGWPDLVPGAIRLSGWLRARYRAVAERIRRLIGRPGAKVETVTAGGVIASGVSLSGIAATSNVGSLEDKVDYLLRRDEDVQRDMSALRERVGAIERNSLKLLAELRQSMEAHVAGELKSALEDYRPLRAAGAFALALGLVCVTVANFVG